MNTRSRFIGLMLTLVLWGCDSQAPKIEAIESQNKSLSCSLNGSPLKIEITKGSLDAAMYYEGKESKINLLEVKDFYQIIMRFNPQIGQLKINKMGNELIQFRNSEERITSCTTQLKSL
ncbi:hypothetical protein [Polynucleobacter sp. AP-Kaivos-20-H2]|uniref:hypothetical protein n=1 Tax=Polynucleobacter sp. AP-Kaivos-20-H2 TaxID=2689104 RepID=UPI001C0BD410|nr:hypothetical protein [Polynucleobacter sp. AP-Kaivos-20-H2]MBU3603786.1 hypothetical protein [Polynucleobacter sp. AP-Kaivos-20-H2]